MTEKSSVLFLGGRSGVGKSSVAFEIHFRLAALGVRHGVIEGDNLDLAYPPPWEHNLAERNLTAMWANYRDLGYRRLVYTNTVSVRFTPDLARAMGDDPDVTAVLLTASDETARNRLARREIGSALARTWSAATARPANWSTSHPAGCTACRPTAAQSPTSPTRRSP